MPGDIVPAKLLDVGLIIVDEETGNYATCCEHDAMPWGYA